jgi:hypothetical protein
LRLAALVFALLLNAAAVAQSRPSLAVVIADLESDAVPCDITRRSLESAAEVALQKHGIVTVPRRGADPVLFLQVVAVPATRGNEPTLECAVALYLQVRAAEARSSYGAFRAPGATVLLCDARWITLAPINRISRSLTNGVADGVAKCLARLSY